jgi:hypothetical protein
VDQGFVAEYMISNDTVNVFGMMAPGHTSESLRAAMKPMISALSSSTSSSLTAKSLNLQLMHRDSYHQVYAAAVEPIMAGNSFAPAVAGRFLPRSVIESDSAAWHAALREVTSISDGRYVIAVTALNAQNEYRNSAVAANSVQPNFKNAFSSLIISPKWSHTEPWSHAAELLDEIENTIMPVLEKVTPGAGAYKNEASWAQKNF